MDHSLGQCSQLEDVLADLRFDGPIHRQVVGDVAQLHVQGVGLGLP